MYNARNAFARSKAMFAAIQASMALPTIVQRQIALYEIGEYRSRGHGGNHHIKSRHTTAQDKRRALKHRNQLRHRASM